MTPTELSMSVLTNEWGSANEQNPIQWMRLTLRTIYAGMLKQNNVAV